MMRISVDLMMSKTRGLMNWRRWANSAPATPAKNDETTKARIFTRRVLTLEQLGRDLVLPDGEDAAAEAGVDEVADEPQTERTVQKKTHGRVVSLSMPRNPRGPPRASMFSRADLTIMPKARVTMAR